MNSQHSYKHVFRELHEYTNWKIFLAPSNFFYIGVANFHFRLEGNNTSPLVR